MTFHVYNGSKDGYFNRDYCLVEANSFTEAIEKIANEWTFEGTGIEQVFVVNTSNENGRLYRVTPATGVKLELAAA